MSSLHHEKEHKEMVVTQVSFGGFDRSVSAKELMHFLEYEVGMIWRCRLKSSWTPPESYPSFNVSVLPGLSEAGDKMDVPPHAFVHFALPDAAKKAINAAGRSELIFQGKPLIVNAGIESSFRVKRRRTVDAFKFEDVKVEIGTLFSRDEFLIGWKGSDSGVNFIVDPFDGRCRILFSQKTAFSFKGTRRVTEINCDFKIEFMVRDVNEIRCYKDMTSLATIFQLSLAPSIYYRTAEDDIVVSVPYTLLDDEDPWIRTTDFTAGGAIGRCSSYRIAFPPRFRMRLEKALAYIKQCRISEHILKSPIMVQNEPDFGAKVNDHFFCVHKHINNQQYIKGITFTTMFLLNAVVHKGILNQHQLSKEFFDLLRSQSDLVNETLLRHIWSYKRPIFDAYRRLKLVKDWLRKNPELLKHSSMSDDNIEIRRLVITPTKAYCLPPEVELSNRVLRNYKHIADRFLRVTFMEEGMQQLSSNVLNSHSATIVRDITRNSFPLKTTIFRRIQTILQDGFYLCGRKYSFLAFSANQLRDRSAWFIADENISKTNAESIRKWMGKFYIRNVAKCAARMGQCFSSTYATVNVPSREINANLCDIKRNDYDFSDGIGMITPDLALEVAKKLQLPECPSAYQIRYAGCKGVVAVWPGDDNVFRLSLRPSMHKFQSHHTMLEVVSWTRFQPGFLNRQIITLLSSLGVSDGIFSRMQDSMLCKLNQMLFDADVAFEVLTASCSEQGNTAAMMLSAGYSPNSEPHLKSMLQCVRSAQLGDLLAKSRIFVPEGRWLMGCLDEFGILEYGQCFIQSSIPSLENCFSKHGSRFSGNRSKKQVIVGSVAIAKNPCLHPGDIRILEAVDVPELHHLVDCLVFPQKGHRPHPNEASGSDLDGDLYFVTWDENLIPPGKKSKDPMDYTPVEAKKLPTAVTSRDIIDFFARTMVHEPLGVICNAHVVHADLSDLGALDEKCLHLAKLAATAVDFPKTGKIVTMPHDMKPKMYPDFMSKEEHQSYKSEKILGKLYRKIKDVHDEEVSSDLICTCEDLPYDKDLYVIGSSDYIREAWASKCSYDAQLNALMSQYRVSTEGEVVSGHIWSMPKYSNKKEGELKERLKHAYSALNKEFRHIFETMGPEFPPLADEEKCTLYEKKASAWYQVTYHPCWVKKSLEMKEPEGDPVSPRLSFAWIATDYLVRIKLKTRQINELDAKKPINQLGKYLSERLW